MKKIRLGYFADGIWGHNALRRLQKDENIEIAFVCSRYDSQDETLKKLAVEFGINYIKSSNVNTDFFINEIDSYSCDLLVSMSFNQIFKREILNKYKIINCHAGKLPFYRGRNILNWVLINDEKEFGITVHFVDEGIDTGDIVIQKTFPINDEDTYASLLEIAHVQCANILHEAVTMFSKGVVVSKKQQDIHPVGMYCGMRGLGDEVIDWTMTSRDLFNFIRAICKPGPMAKCLCNEKSFFINKAEIVPQAPMYKGIAGQILYKKNEDLFVKTQDSIIKITEYYCDEKVRVGMRLQ